MAAMTCHVPYQAPSQGMQVWSLVLTSLFMFIISGIGCPPSRVKFRIFNTFVRNKNSCVRNPGHNQLRKVVKHPHGVWEGNYHASTQVVPIGCSGNHSCACGGVRLVAAFSAYSRQER